MSKTPTCSIFLAVLDLSHRIKEIIAIKCIITKNTKTIHTNIHTSNKDTYETLGTLLLTAPNMAVRVSKVVMVIVNRPEKSVIEYTYELLLYHDIYS